MSLPTRERGLKYAHGLLKDVPESVAPHTGAWIEMIAEIKKVQDKQGRSPHGSVD